MAPKHPDPDSPIYFYGRGKPYGYLSQMYVSGFTVDDVYYPTTEHFFQAAKARKFNDDARLQAILDTDDPFKAKKIGGSVRRFDGKVWEEVAWDIVVEANLYKFRISTEAPVLAARLKATGGRHICEASPKDKVWGIGCSAATAAEKGKYTGKNLLGLALEEVRLRLLDDEWAAQIAAEVQAMSE